MPTDTLESSLPDPWHVPDWKGALRELAWIVVMGGAIGAAFGLSIGIVLGQFR